MSLTKFNKNINYHQNQLDKPVMSATQLKKLFDQAGLDIKEYINETLTEELDTINENKVSKSEIYYPETGSLKYKTTGAGSGNTLDLSHKLVFGLIDYVVSTNVAIFVYVPCQKKFRKDTSISLSSQIIALTGRIYLTDGTRIIPTTGSDEDLKEHVSSGSIYAKKDDNYLRIRLTFPSEYFGDNLQLLKEKQTVRIDFTEIDLNYN
jgi:hypothetical protein